MGGADTDRYAGDPTEEGACGGKEHSSERGVWCGEQERAVPDGVAAGACGGVRVPGVEHERCELVEGRDRAARGRGGRCAGHPERGAGGGEQVVVDHGGVVCGGGGEWRGRRCVLPAGADERQLDKQRGSGAAGVCGAGAGAVRAVLPDNWQNTERWGFGRIGREVIEESEAEEEELARVMYSSEELAVEEWRNGEGGEGGEGRAGEDTVNDEAGEGRKFNATAAIICGKEKERGGQWEGTV
ncbi:uncharacterized protein MONOS_5607 [Monocercomonoides exilis]|uniref:uncharacterized protein n=1 Tax=Monocercomonoides exilis TaxID=2049356 RepID=UPI003559DC04|nr:hypothetical protein MONOS_5607 [Monocercomonoides exilis]|eukprot:MONOS_5607.1-p1 / transcript=MONOS_5607.1 / gene=MONOS_5607 / organism=Monocercomonoides_exilis_PA203 / gene_product=unspecified product / transcript_product=unspecified product / location=Mono_scaffold00165:42974-43755(-) / protein_length=242 / sequence_SO=supercontig / SO=protein_coding / is_pseudo=false